MSDLVILVPIYNEGKVFQAWFPSLLDVSEKIGADVVVIDDGSSVKVQMGNNDQITNPNVQRGNTGQDPRDKVQGNLKSQIHNSKFLIPDSEDEDDPSFAEATEDSGVRSRFKVLRHPVNCGVGAALQTGMEYAKSLNPNYVFTIDGDGQHDPRDLVSLYNEIKAGDADIVNGSRFLKKQAIPFMRRLANFSGNIVNFLLSGYWLTDSQSGMKVISAEALQKIKLVSPGYEWCIDLFREANVNHFRIKEFPVSVLYNSYTLNKGQGFSIGIDMIFRLIIRSLTRSIV